MKVVTTLRKLGHACRGMLAVACLWSMSSLLFTACDSEKLEENIDPMYAVDLGLSVKWAWCNVGASRPEEYGDYFAWGETEPVSNYYEGNSVTYRLSISELESRGIIDAAGNLTATYDAATMNWGGNWRMPTLNEMRELINECEWEWTSVHGVEGRLVTGPNGNSIFLPAAGYRNGDSPYYAGSKGYYWFATSDNGSDDACGLFFDSDYYYRDYYSRFLSFSVRPVKGERSNSDDEVDGDNGNMHGTKTSYTVNGVSFTMIGVEGGTFTMGSPDSDSDAYDSEKPAHQVTLSSYYIGETEVTQELWKAVMGSNPSNFTGDLQRPVEQVTWNDCQTFISKLNELTGESFRLPTEAEWEYAARGGKESRGYKYSGSNTIGDVAWCNSNSSSTTHAVKTKKPNELGVYDMGGNVYEWCSDWYNSSYYSSCTGNNPTGPSSGSFRVLRGGSWGRDAGYCRVAYRSGIFPGYGNSDYGFRLSLQFIP